MAEFISEAAIPSENEPIEASVKDEVSNVVESIVDAYAKPHCLDKLQELQDYTDDAAVWAFFGVGGPA